MDDLNGFNPPRYLQNPHLQTVLNSQGPRRLRAGHLLKNLVSKHLTLQAEDGTRLLAELDHAAMSRSALVILLHGWEGSSRSSYLVTMAAHLLAESFQARVM